MAAMGCEWDYRASESMGGGGLVESGFQAPTLLEFSIPKSVYLEFYQFGISVEISHDAVKWDHWHGGSWGLWMWLGAVDVAAWVLAERISACLIPDGTQVFLAARLVYQS